MKLPKFHYVVAGVCGYEVFAILSKGKVKVGPVQFKMITTFDRDTRHALAPFIIGGLIVHFFEDELRTLRKEKIVPEDN